MKANYHTHTWRCMHAAGTEREYVERAIEAGLEVLGFSDHTPYPFPEGYESGFRMLPDQLENYVITISTLKKEYQRDIEIHVGLETEYYPAYFTALQDLIRDCPVEYMILGQHFLGSEIGEPYSGRRTVCDETLKRYVTQSIQGMETGYFTYFAHPDLINYVGSPDTYCREMRKICRAAKHLEVPLEINLLGVSDYRNYPNPLFWEIAGEEKCNVILGSDAHQPEAVYDPDAIRRAEKIVEKYHLNLLERAVLRRPV